mmetsp:Transcript_22796/g.91284  ORF Transcript_22796/g.91284 Transcript_22796/m.91284 type:complete len:619 (-) Transcript_22796:1523-3379(-)|eukprot:CAMPEP_0113965190 /NCGR_PEP_ID=MMETSP0011_2-20120614/7604_1 /TAXON_ID=101924 /ORGANISM="Rhodosorus marinus" /LENGTH=618 /DNA_ID=CAMNT_0000977669 /DNA_START=306 /DNA_END=2162 /DNA_ORIENTATION=+ /assembly_acc=CAM_ASM_000156
MNGMNTLPGSECGFDVEGTIFATAQGVSGKIAVYNAQTGDRRRDFSSAAVGSGSPFAVVVGNTTQTNSSGKTRSKKRARRKSADNVVSPGKEPLVCAGYGGGTVQLFSAAFSEGLKLAGHDLKPQTAVKSLALSQDSSVLYSAASDNSICSWSTTSGEKLKKDVSTSGQASCLRVSPTGKLLAVGATRLALLDTNTLKPSRVFVGHASTVTDIVFASDEILYSGCSGDRHVSRWETRSSMETSVASYLASAPTTSLSTDGKDHLAALGTDGIVSIFKVSKAGKPYSTVQPNVLSVSMPRPGCVVVAHGSKLKPQFDSFEVEKGIVELEYEAREQTGDMAGGQSRSGKHLLDAEHRAKVLTTDVLEKKPVLETKKTDREEAEPSNGVDDEDDDDDENEGPSIEERLAQIGVKSAADAEDDSQRRLRPLQRDGGADSVAYVLGQALKTKDGVLLEKALSSVRKRSEIESTIGKLSADSIVPLLLALSARLRSRPRRAATLSVWLRALVIEHASLLRDSSGGEVSQALASLHQSVEERVRLHQRFAALDGRLELVLAQAKRVASVRESELVQDRPVLEYAVEEGTEEGEDGERADADLGESEEEEEDFEGHSDEDGDLDME